MNYNDQLMHRCADGIATASELDELAARLKDDADLRGRYLDLLNLDTALEAQSVVCEAVGHAPSPMGRSWLLRYAAAAAGIAIGALAVGTAWAFAQPRAPRVIPVAVADAGFETGTVLALGGVPAQGGHWQGDACEVVPPSGKVKARSGRGMLRFVSVNTADNEADPGPICSDLWQVVPLPPDRDQVVRVRAHFNSDTGGKPARFHLYAMASAGDAAQLPAQWAGRFGESSDVLASGRVMKFTDNDPATWEAAEVSLNAPPEARVLLIAIAAYRLPHTKPADFLPAQFADDVIVSCSGKEEQP